jgi:MFS family permease
MCVGAAVFYFFPRSFAWLTTATAITSIAAGTFIANLYNYTASAYPTRVRSVGTGGTDGVGHAGAVAGPLIASALFAVTAFSHHIAWFLWFTIAGSLLPGFLLLGLGMKQKRAVLEVISK